MIDETSVPEDERMVLRTVYLPPELDEKLRVWAFRMRMTKNDVIRQAVARELAQFASFGEDADRPATPKAVGKSGAAKRASGPTRARSRTDTTGTRVKEG